MNEYFWHAFLILTFFISDFSFAIEGSKQEIKTFGEYKVVIDRYDGLFGNLTIFKKSIKIFEEKDDYFYFGNYYDNTPADDNDIYSGKDINGNKIPDLVITKSTGGAHCCQFLHIFELGKVFHKIVTLDGGSNGFKFIDLDNDEIPEIEFWDWPIDYAFSSFAESAQGKTIVKFVDGQYRVAASMMKKSAPSQKEQKNIVAEIRGSFINGEPYPTYTFLKHMMDLSYSGHLNLALKIADKAWPHKFNGLSKFKEKFPLLLKESQYWKDFSLQTTNKPLVK